MPLTRWLASTGPVSDIRPAALAPPSPPCDPPENEEPPMSDTLPTATRVADPGIRALYRLENRWQAWLDVEGALARAQAELGIIPAEAAEAIAKAARLENMDRTRIDQGFARTG